MEERGIRVKKRISVQDIATELGMSRNTVSKALQGSELVAYNTCQKVVRKALEMGYDKIAPEVIKAFEKEGLENKSFIVIAKKESSEFWNRIIFGIGDALSKTEYSFTLHFVTEEEEATLILPKDIVLGKVSGIISLSVFSTEYNKKLFSTNLPMVCYDMPCTLDSFEADVILVEGTTSVYKIINELVRQIGRASCRERVYVLV